MGAFVKDSVFATIFGWCPYSVGVADLASHRVQGVTKNKLWFQFEQDAADKFFMVTNMRYTYGDKQTGCGDIYRPRRCKG